jgi:uncharacterized membrane protein YoaK (UPF0700 family)
MSVGVTVLVFLVGACLGVLVGIFIMLVRLSARLSAMHEELTELLEEAADNVRESDAEQHRHLDAAGTVVTEQMRQVGRALALEIRGAAKKEQRRRNQEGHR